MEKNFNEQESLQLINSMIAEARNNVSKGDGMTLLFVGYSLVVISLLNALLLHLLTPSYMAYNVWWLMLPVTFIVFWIGHKQDKKATVRTHIDKIATGVWSVFVWSMFLVFILSFGFAFSLKNTGLGIMLTPVILVLVGFAQYVVGIAYKYAPFMKGAIVFWIGAILCMVYFYVMKEESGQYIIFALSVIGGFIIPGHMLNKKTEQNV
ncbi:hypothetical protein M2459_000902 [Parabacteroides sp. PF5-5]|uniref:hypothetical protein n=1 Tax=unclassified Parabacteroides TaxID=2649774 RepID=UPI00247625A5|nr:MULTISPECIES: hypothetical protein [unclassified Parabacteroides]MDH6304174.1 hypothetical protein [Parabacteroides sp. PH5-39]MDH6315110.1 hypothetical protein [Parabacteroides sp. PF5-13]MDH6318771.1 hypothetical protein [Parabacteroides sp. PH5-13]MDH6322500.1 hypothetical protein [Parabacteroides sp. PH5-8]MDH6326364.1 hypothetical protein [Parabacteroides sp. PH5-41]